MNKNNIKKYIPHILIFLLILIICIPIFTMNLYLNNEAILHMTRIFSIDEVIKDGTFPPIIDYKFMNGFGYALNLFYGPITTYIPIILLNIFGTSGMALKIFTVLTVIFSAITNYHFVYTVTKRKSIATIATLIYISMPYKLSDIYSRNAVGEYTAFIFIPIVFESLYNLMNNKKKSYMLAVGIIGLVLSHTITTIYIALFALIYVLFNFAKTKNIEFWKNVIINICISLLICSFYVLPLLEHSYFGNYTLFSDEEMGTSGQYVSATSLGLKDLFESETGESNIRFSIGIVVIILSVLTIYCFKKVKEEHKGIYRDFMLLSLITLMMCTKLFPWYIMPKILTVIQFAWRNMGFFAFFISLVCGINAVVFAENVLKKDIYKETFLFGVICTIFVFTFLGVLRDYRFDDLSKEKELDNIIKSSARLHVYNINREYLPLNAINNLQYITDRENITYILSGDAKIVLEEKNKLEDNLILKDVKQDTELELPYIYYLGYTVNINDGENIKTIKTTESEKGFLKINLDAAENITINIKYTGTALEKIGYIVTIFGIIIYICVSVKQRKE